jgi:(1->4)-alpha-D-glucan 1-alpha-D-glucosylmutase
VYLSPVLQSTLGSSHGYDTTDPGRVDRDRGGAEGLQAVLDGAREAGLGVVVDLVPNHLGISVPAENPAWWDVLQHGRESAYAGWFDIDWSRDRIVVPILGDDATLTLEDGELRYYEHRFPLARGPGPRATTRPRCTTGSTTSWCTTAAATPSSTTAASSP